MTAPELALRTMYGLGFGLPFDMDPHRAFAVGPYVLASVRLRPPARTPSMSTGLNVSVR